MAKRGPPPKKKTDLDHLKELHRFKLWCRLVDASKWVVGIVATAAPLWTVFLAVQALAGSATTVKVSVSLAIGVTLALTGLPGGIVLALQQRKIGRQRDEIIRLRERVENLQSRIAEMKGEAVVS